MQKVMNSKKYSFEEETKHSNKLATAIKESYYKMHKVFANSSFIGCLKKSIVMTLPIIVLGVIFSIILNLPFDSYQNFIDGTDFQLFLKGAVNTTFGSITLLLTIILTYKYMKDKITSYPIMTITIITAVICVALLSCKITEITDDLGEIFKDANPNFGFENIYLGIIFSFFSVKVFAFFSKKKIIKYKVYTTETKKNVILIIHSLLPFLIVFIPSLIIFLLVFYFNIGSLTNVFAKPFILIFENANIDLLNGVIYAFISSVGLFFGVGVDEAFNSANMSGVINPNFMNVFVFIPMMVGLAISLLIFSKRRTDRIYGASAIPTSAFGLFKPIHYGYSLILNPFSIIPTLIIPIVTTITSYLLFLGFNIDSSGTFNYNFLFLNAYRLTDSYWAILIVIINVAISGLIFIPFILLNNYAKDRAFKDNIKELYPKYIEAKAKNKRVTIFDFDYELGETAKVLCNQLIKDMELMKEVETKVIDFNKQKESYNKKEFELKKRELLDKLKKQLKIKSYFQPIVSNHVEFDEENKPTYFDIKGMECLMRWWYDGNYIIPPLALEIARYADLEYEINYYLWQNMLINVDRKKCKSFITFNISMNCLEKTSFIDDITTLFDRYDMDPSGFVIEITEEDEFKNEENALNKIIELKEKGFDFAIDDYGAGQTSMKYFSTNAFELVKIDGDLVKKAKENEQVYDIIGNIKELGKKGQKYANIQFKVLCEFIEDKDSFERLAKLKVDYYQGYLFGKAQEFDEIVSSPMMAKGSQKHV